MKIWYVYSPRRDKKVYIFKAQVVEARYGWDFNPRVFLSKGKVTIDGIIFKNVEINKERWQIDDRAEVFKKKFDAIRQVEYLVKWNLSALDGPYHYHTPIMMSAPTRLD